MRAIVLASSSAYRRQLLERLQVPFTVAAPDVDEQAHAGEAVDARVERLAIAKARAVAARHADALVIGSDQLASVGDDVLGKPGDRAGAIIQLRRCRGQAVHFRTAVAVLDARDGRIATRLVRDVVTMRPFDDATIERYVDRDRPFDCAGSFRSEGLGITLFSALRSDDPTSLVGLPLIAVVDLLAEHGIELPL